MDIKDRLEEFLKLNNLTASSLADRIQVQRSSVSHVLSGRNKPSLDFVAKIIDVYPDIDLKWFVSGVKSVELVKNDLTNNSLKDVDSSSVKKIVRVTYVFSDGSFESYVN
jgi:transcriptional regulator with XRE-family HTH domain